MDNSEIKQQALLFIREKMLKGKIEEATEELQNLIKSLESNIAIMKNMQLLGDILIIAGIAANHIHQLLRTSSKMILRQKGIDPLFQYWIVLQEQDPELYRYANDVPEEELVDYAGKIDTQSIFNKNISWFSKYNKKFLNDLFKGSDYKLDNLTGNVESAYRTSHLQYYKINRKWYYIHIEKKALGDNKEDASIPLLYRIQDTIHMADVVSRHNSRVLINDTFKFDRYIIIDADIISILLQILPFSQLDNGNYWFHFLLNTRWKKRLTEFGKMGYIIPNKAIASENKLQNILQFLKELNAYFDNNLFQENITELTQIYVSEYLNVLRKKYQEDLSRMRILIMTSRHSNYIQYASETLNKGFKKIGCKSVLLREGHYQGAGFKLEFVFRLIKKFKPNLILAVNNFRPDWSTQLLPEIPYAAWIHDPPETLPRPCNTITDNDFIFAAVKAHIDKDLPEAYPVLKEYDISLIPFVRDINKNFPLIKNKKYDIGCITNIGVLPEVLSYYEPEKCIGSSTERLIHYLLKKMGGLEPCEIASIIRSKEKSLAIVQKGLEELNIHTSDKLDKKHPLVADTFQFGICQFLQKTLSVRYLINNGFTNIFIGGYGWDQLEFFRPYAAGQVPHEDLPSAVGNIAINLNPTAELTFHPRIGEMLEANSFVISSWKGDADALPLTDYFIEDEEIVLFRTYKDLVKKVEYFLKHPEKREAITKKAKEKFIRNFSAEMGCRKILNQVLGINSVE